MLERKRDAARGQQTMDLFSKPKLTATIHFDGGCNPNPGFGYGSYRVQSNRAELNNLESRIQFGGNMTNNQAEYLACIAALEWLKEKLTETRLNPKDIAITVMSDSDLLVQQVNRTWKCKNPVIVALRDRIWALLKHLGQVEVKWNSRNVNVQIFGH